MEDWRGGKVLEAVLEGITRTKFKPTGKKARDISYLSFSNNVGVEFYGVIPNECIGHLCEYNYWCEQQEVIDKNTGKKYLTYKEILAR